MVTKFVTGEVATSSVVLVGEDCEEGAGVELSVGEDSEEGVGLELSADSGGLGPSGEVEEPELLLLLLLLELALAVTLLPSLEMEVVPARMSPAELAVASAITVSTPGPLPAK